LAAGFRADFVRVFFAAICCFLQKSGTAAYGHTRCMLQDIYCHLWPEVNEKNSEGLRTLALRAGNHCAGIANRAGV
jgi:hypothetical protein